MTGDDTLVMTNAERPCKDCGAPVTTAVPGPAPTCLSCQDADEGDSDDTLAVLLKVLRELDQEGVLLGVYGIDDDRDAPLAQAVRRWREAGYPLDAPPRFMISLDPAEPVEDRRDPSKLMVVDPVRTTSVYMCVGCGAQWGSGEFLGPHVCPGPDLEPVRKALNALDESRTADEHYKAAEELAEAVQPLLRGQR